MASSSNTTSSSNNSSQFPSIRIFDGEDYSSWKVQMRTILRAEGLWLIIEKGFDEKTEDEERMKTLIEDRLSDYKALARIQVCVNRMIFQRIINAETSNEAWKILESEFEGNTRTLAMKLSSVRRDYEHMLMGQNEKIGAFLGRVMGLVNTMKMLGKTFSDQEIIEKVLMSLPERYEGTVAVIEETKDITTMKVDELFCSLAAHDQRHIRRSHLYPPVNNDLETFIYGGRGVIQLRDLDFSNDECQWWCVGF